MLPLPSGYEKRRGGQRLTDETYPTPTSGEAGNEMVSFTLQDKHCVRTSGEVAPSIGLKGTCWVNA